MRWFLGSLPPTCPGWSHKPSERSQGWDSSRGLTPVPVFLGWKRDAQASPSNPKQAQPRLLGSSQLAGMLLLSVFILQQQTQTGSHSAPCPEVKCCSIRWLRPQEARTDRRTPRHKSRGSPGAADVTVSRKNFCARGFHCLAVVKGLPRGEGVCDGKKQRLQEQSRRGKAGEGEQSRSQPRIVQMPLHGEGTVSTGDGPRI